MRFFLIALLLWTVPAYADDPLASDIRAAQQNATSDSEVKKEKAAGDDSAAEDTGASHDKADAKPKVNWVDVESTGILSSAKQGALEKTLWAKQKRSEIEENLQKLPDRFDLRTALSLQRRLLLSKTDTSLMIDDIGPLRGRDMLIQRINKLMEMGLYDDAWELYTQKAEEPYDVSIAQLGMLLLVMKNDLATACLEEKVFSAKYQEDRFFDTLDRACSQTLGASKPPKFPDDAVLQSIYNDAGYSVGAANPQALARMTSMERALVLANGKIRYDGLTPQILAKTPSMILTLYLMDKNLPETGKSMVVAETRNRGLGWVVPAARDPALKRAKDLAKDPEDQWKIIESIMKETANPVDMAPFADYIVAQMPTDLSTETLTKALGVLLASQKGLSDYWLAAAQKAAPEKPIIYIYLQAFKSLTPTRPDTIKAEDFYGALKNMKEEDAAQIIAILGTLDNKSEILKDPLNVYEKHSDLTSDTNYVMPSKDLKGAAEEAPERKQLGITVLAVLNSLAAGPDNMYSGAVRNAVESMLNVGLLDDAKQMGGEALASVLNKY